MYCKHCGAEIFGNAKFCSKCGKKTEGIKFVVNDGTKKRIPIFLLIVVVFLVLIITLCPILEVRELIYNLGSRDLGYTTMLVNSVENYYADEFSGIMAITRITYVFTMIVSFSIFVFSYLEKDIFAFVMSVAYFPIIAFCVFTLISQIEQVTSHSSLFIDLTEEACVLLFVLAFCVFAIFIYCFISMIFALIKKHKRKNM